MAVTLAADTTDFGRTASDLRDIAAAIDTILLYVVEDRDYRPELDAYFGLASEGRGIFHNPAVYEDLRATGLGVISRAPLRQQIIRFYDSQVPAVQVIERIRVFPYRVELLLPEMQAKVAFLGSGTELGARPIDYGSLGADVRFLNAMRGYGSEVDLQALLTGEAHQGATALLQEIQAELVRR